RARERLGDRRFRGNRGGPQHVRRRHRTALLHPPPHRTLTEHMNTLWQCPDDADTALVLAPGAGAGMRHRSLQALADALARQRIATLRFEFPFMAAGRKRVDPKPVATAAIAEACAEASARSDLPLWLGGHSFGGRMASHAVLEHDLAI